MHLPFEFAPYVPEAIDGKAIEKRLLGGLETVEKEFPYHGSLIIQGKYGCPLTLITEYHLISVASCLVIPIRHLPNTTDVRVLLGSWRLFHGILYSVKRISHYKGYQPQSAVLLPGNIGVVHLAKPVAICQSILLIALPPMNYTTPAGTLVTVSGFGSTTGLSRPSLTLRKLQLRTEPLDKCQLSFPGQTIHESSICVIPQPGYGCAEGDSGNPMVDTAHSMLIGIASIGRGCGQGYPEIYTNVGYYIQYIQDEIHNIGFSRNSSEHPAINYVLS